jgi:hypothetical protein
LVVGGAGGLHFTQLKRELHMGFYRLELTNRANLDPADVECRSWWMALLDGPPTPDGFASEACYDGYSRQPLQLERRGPSSFELLNSSQLTFAGFLSAPAPRFALIASAQFSHPRELRLAWGRVQGNIELERRDGYEFRPGQVRVRPLAVRA